MKFIHATRANLISELQKKRVILFGASVQPEEVWNDLLLSFNVDISKSVEMIVDNDTCKQGKSFLLSDRSFIIESPSKLTSIDWSENIILITSRFYIDIIDQLKAMDALKDAEVYAWPCVTLDREKTPEEKYEIRIRQEALNQYEFWLGNTNYPEITKSHLRQKMRNTLLIDGYRVIPRVAIMHSNICSLKCHNCCDMLPQVKKPYYIPAAEIISDLELLLSGVDLCMSVDLTDGEGLLYRELDEVLDFVLNNPKIATVMLISNGTIMPKESTLKLMRHPKFWINVSDYGIPERSNPVIAALSSNSINLSVTRDLAWKDLKVNSIQKRTESRELLRYEFLRCRNKLCSKAYIHRKLYACMPAFRMSNLGIFESERDYITINESDSPDQIWEKIYHICMLDYIDACDYCNFENTGVDIIPAGS